MSRFREPIRILSDLHLAHPGSRIVSPAQLAPLLDGVETVIFNGDTLEERMKKFRDRAEVQLEELKGMCAQAGVEMVMLRGNHDPYSPPHGALDLCGGKVFVTHGDVLFPEVSPWSRNIESAREALARIEQDYPADYRQDLELSLEVSRRVTQEMVVHQPAARPGLIGRLKTMVAQAWPPKRPLTVLKVWIGAPTVAERVLERYRPEAKIFVVGHTHRAFCVRRHGRLLVNTGAFLPLSKALAVDIADGELTVRKIRERGGEFVLGSQITRVRLDERG